MKITNITYSSPVFPILNGLTEDYRIDGRVHKENFLKEMKEKWTIRFKFRDDDDNSDIEEIEIDDEFYTLLALKYVK